MAKQRTPNLELVTLNDDDQASFFADQVENLGKIDAADQARQDVIAAETERALAAEQALGTGNSQALQHAIAERTAADVILRSGAWVSGQLQPTGT